MTSGEFADLRPAVCRDGGSTSRRARFDELRKLPAIEIHSEADVSGLRSHGLWGHMTPVTDTYADYAIAIDLGEAFDFVPAVTTTRNARPFPAALSHVGRQTRIRYCRGMESRMAVTTETVGWTKECARTVYGAVH